MALPDCGAEDEIRRTEALARQQDEEAQAYAPDERDAWSEGLSPADISELALEDRELEDRWLTKTYTAQDARLLRLEAIPSELILAPEVGLQLKSQFGPRDCFVDYDEVQDRIIYAELSVGAHPLNRFGDVTTTAGPMVGVRISFNDSQDPYGDERAAIIVLPRDEAQAEEIFEFAKSLVKSPDRKAENASAVVEELKCFAESHGANTHELMPRFPLNCIDE